MIKINGIFLDDYVLEGKKGWTQVCNKCLDKFPAKMRDENSGHGICGVCGCENEADHYIDFNI